MTPEQARGVLQRLLENERPRLTAVQAEAVQVAVAHLLARDYAER